MNPRKSGPGGALAGRGRPVRASEAPTSAREAVSVAAPVAPSINVVFGMDGGGDESAVAVHVVEDRVERFLRLARAM